MSADRANNPSQHKAIVMGAAERGGKRFFMDLNIHPRKQLMKRAIFDIVLPALALSTIATVIFFPTPGALSAAIKEATRGPTLSPAVLESSDARFIVEDHANGIPGLTAEIEAQSDCFIGLEHASPQRLQECAPAVTAIIAQIVEHQNNPAVAAALEEGGGNLLPQIQVAAAEVCRTLWSSAKSLDAYLNDPSCQMAQVALAPQMPLR